MIFSRTVSDEPQVMVAPLASYRGVRHLAAERAARQAHGEPVDPSEYYHGAAFFFETGDPRYGWLNLIVAVALGERLPSGVRYRVFEVSGRSRHISCFPPSQDGHPGGAND